MLGSWLLQLTTVSAVLLSVAVVAVLRVSRRAHRADLRDGERRRRVAVAATLVGVGGLVLAGLLGAGAWSAVAVAAVLTGTVLARGRVPGSWSVRGMTASALGGTTAVAAVVWLLHRISFSSAPAAAVVASMAMVPLLVWALVQLRGPWETWIEAKTSAERRAPGEPSAVHPVLVLTAAAATGGAVLALTSGGTQVGPVAPVSRADGPGHPTSIRPEQTPTSPERSSPAPTRAAPSSADAAPGPPLAPVTTSAVQSGPAPQERTTAAAQTDGPATPSPSATSSPQAGKTPGYEKGKRPSDAPSPPGHAKP